MTFDFPSGKEIVGFAGETARQMARLPDASPDNRPEGYAWTTHVRSQEISVGGRLGIATEYQVECLVESAHCNFQIEGIQRWSQIHGSRVAVITVELSGDDMLTLVVMTEDPTAFDAYWAAVVEPLLDSIEFLGRTEV